jgi:hypothetical protein
MTVGTSSSNALMGGVSIWLLVWTPCNVEHRWSLRTRLVALCRLGEIPVRHNLLRFHLPEREIMTGIGPVAVRCPRVRDRAGEGPERIRFSSAILPPYARRSKSLEVLIPILYLTGVSTGEFEKALIALLGKDASGLSASTVGSRMPGRRSMITTSA